MPVKVGDRITVSAASVNAPERTGTVATVVRQDPLRVEVRWDDGHTTIISPADGAASIVLSNDEAAGAVLYTGRWAEAHTNVEAMLQRWSAECADMVLA